MYAGCSVTGQLDPNNMLFAYVAVIYIFIQLNKSFSLLTLLVLLILLVFPSKTRKILTIVPNMT